MKQYPSQAVPQVQSTLAKLTLCRTAALGGRKLKCTSCHETTIVYNSCGDRHCPCCSGARRSDWLESTRELIADGVDHFQVVFTLPGGLSSLALGNRRVIYDLLFAAAWKAIKSSIADEQGYDVAALMVLHTWNQKLEAHAHVHAVVPACGPQPGGSGLAWAMKDHDPETTGKYLVDAADLKRRFRECFLRGLDRLRKQGQLKLEAKYTALRLDLNWLCLKETLRSIDWVVYIQAPTVKGQSAEPILKYLARYLAGGPISDSRIVSVDEQSVTFRARSGEVSGGSREQVPLTLSQVEFTRRWCLHILPKGYTRTRRFGGWSNTKRKMYLSLMKSLLPQREPKPANPSAAIPTAVAESDSFESARACPSCGAALIPHSDVPKPGWSKVMSSSYRPSWYHHL